jgi:hypothetical protein
MVVGTSLNTNTKSYTFHAALDIINACYFYSNKVPIDRIHGYLSSWADQNTSEARKQYLSTPYGYYMTRPDHDKI